jgi:hypothetical protein
MELIFPNQPVNPTITQALGHYPTTPIRGWPRQSWQHTRSKWND